MASLPYESAYQYAVRPSIVKEQCSAVTIQATLELPGLTDTYHIPDASDQCAKFEINKYPPYSSVIELVLLFETAVEIYLNLFIALDMLLKLPFNELKEKRGTGIEFHKISQNFIYSYLFC